MNQDVGRSYHLGVDLGTTYTAAATYAAGQIEVVDLGNRATSVPSVVFLGEDGQFVVGEGAERRAHAEPSRVAREFKRRLGDPTPVVLGGVPCSADLLTAELLKAVVDHVSGQLGAPPATIALTHPAAWGPYKLDLLRQAARIAECGQALLISEPEAAVLHYSSSERVEPGAVVAVYDFGGGTFDAAVVRKTEEGTEVLGRPVGIESLGGVDLDQQLLRLVYEGLGDEGQQLDQSDPLVQSALLRLRDECRDAKEGLSMVDHVTVPVMLPSTQQTVDISREEFEATAAPLIEQTIDALGDAMASAGVTPSDLHAVLLAGGSSRVPLVQQMVGERMGRPVALDAHPKFIVAMGAAGAAARASGPVPEPDLAVPVLSDEPLADDAPSVPDAALGAGLAAATPAITEGAPDQDTTAVPQDAVSVFAEPAEPMEPPREAPELTTSSVSVFEGGSETPEPPDPAATVAVPVAAPAPPPTEPVPMTPGEPHSGPAADGAGEGDGSFPWVLLVVGVLLFAGIVGGFVLFSGGNDEPPGEEAGATPSEGATVGDNPSEESSQPDAPTEVPEATAQPDPTEAPAPTEAIPVFEPAIVQTVQVGDTPDTPLAAGGLLWVPNSGSDTVTRVEPVSGASEDIVVGARPDTPIEALGAVWVPARDAGTVARVDLDDLSVTSIAVGTRADTPTFAADHLWVAVRGTNEMVIIDPTDNTVVQTIALQGRPLTPIVVGNELWFATRDDSALNVVDLATFDPSETVVFETISVGTDPERPIEAEGRIWVPSRENASVDVVDPTSRQVIATVAVGIEPDTPVAEGGRLWISNAGTDTVTVVDAETLEVDAEITVGSGPRTGVAAGGSVWIPVAGASTLVQLDSEQSDLVETFVTGLEPDTPVVADDSVWVPNAGSASVLQLQIS